MEKVINIETIQNNLYEILVKFFDLKAISIRKLSTELSQGNVLRFRERIGTKINGDHILDEIDTEKIRSKLERIEDFNEKFNDILHNSSYPVGSYLMDLYVETFNEIMNSPIMIMYIIVRLLDTDMKILCRDNNPDDIAIIINGEIYKIVLDAYMKNTNILYKVESLPTRYSVIAEQDQLDDLICSEDNRTILKNSSRIIEFLSIIDNATDFCKKHILQ